MLVFALAFSILGAATAAAASLWGDFEGFNRTKVYINSEEKQFADGETPSFQVGDEPVLPLKVLKDSLHSLFKWDNGTKTLDIYKPNVHMFVAKEVGKDYSIKTPFGGVKKGDTMDFAVFAQVDSLKTEFYSFKISIETPSGVDAAAPHEKVVNGQRESFWYPWPFNVKFNEAGNYTVKFSIKQDESSGYTVVSEKVIVSE
jgi:hypothetical protein